MNRIISIDRRMTIILAGFLAVVLASGLSSMASAKFPAASDALWIARQQGLYLSGLMSIALMSLCMLLALRPTWLETPLGGLDRIYRMHKWAGILAVSFGALHWLLKESSGLIAAMIGKTGRVPKFKYDGLLEVLREFGKDMGEPALYIALVMIAIALWRRFPYHLWRHLHRLMPILYLMLALHSAVLAPSALLSSLGFWTQPAGLMLAVCLTIGVIASLISLSGMIAHHRRIKAHIIEIKQHNDICEITCQLDKTWDKPCPGQFAFISFNRLEGAHPFTIAGTDQGLRTITFCIKALGDFTRKLPEHVKVGQVVTIEGPYGRFQLNRLNPRRQQIWIAGGIGITPFLAWLEALQVEPEKAPEAELHYCTRDRDEDPFASRLQALCAALPGIRLFIHSARHGNTLSADTLKAGSAGKKQTEIWFCGPSGLAEALKKGLRNISSGRLYFHQEAFEMR